MATKSSSGSAPRTVKLATIERLPIYLRILDQLMKARIETVSSDTLAKLSGHSGDTVRRDMWALSVSGLRGVGYAIDSLHARIRMEIGQEELARIVIVGIGHIGEALANYKNFASRGLEVVALFDSDHAKVGEFCGVVPIQSSAEIRQECRRLQATIGVVATPGESAQHATDELVAGGVRGVLNFAPVMLSVPDDVWIRQVDLLAELQILQYLLTPIGKQSKPMS